MTIHSGPVFRAIDRGLLRCASFFVPEKQRSEWRLEWESELWHVRRSNDASGTYSWRTEREIAGFCLGAFQDATCLRRLSWQDRPRFAPLHGSAAQCLLWLASLLFVSYLCSLLSPGVRAAREFTNAQIRPGTILIEDEEAEDNSAPTMAIDQVRIWERSRQRYADGFAFYRVARESVQPGPHLVDTWRIAEASSNLFAVVGWTLRSRVPNEDARTDMPRLVLSERTWRQRFAANPEIVGKVLLVGARPVQVVGIAPGDTWRLPGNSDAWLLESDSEFGRNRQGFVIAHLTPKGRSEMWGGLVPITSYDSQQSEHAFLGISLEQHQPGPWSIYWFGVLLALLALPAIASVSLAEYSFSSQKPFRRRRAFRVGFFAAKVALILSIAYFSSIDLAYWHSPALSPSGAYIQSSVSFAIVLFGMRWALLDQRERCPVCLRRVTHPAQVGSFSRVFLAWSGTELICIGGHTLLHVPGLPTSWFSAQRWMYLDSSWDFLFAG
jgi:MacB-like periplasmic core domain